MKYKYYFNYLNRRSRIGFLYRQFFLYPILQRKLINPVLDIGCGIGDYLRFNPNSTGIDINPYTINKLKSQGYKAYLMRDNIIPKDDSSFPSIILDNVLEHIEEPQPLLLDIYRVLKPKGVLMIGVPGLKGYVEDSDHKVFYSEKRLIQLLELMGFSHFKTIITPLKCPHLSKYLRQYCVYAFFTK